MKSSIGVFVSTLLMPNWALATNPLGPRQNLCGVPCEDGWCCDVYTECQGSGDRDEPWECVDGLLTDVDGSPMTWEAVNWGSLGAEVSSALQAGSSLLGSLGVTLTDDPSPTTTRSGPGTASKITGTITFMPTQPSETADDTAALVAPGWGLLLTVVIALYGM